MTRRDRAAPWMAAPALAIVSAVVLAPSTLAVWRSMERRDLVSRETAYVGVDNYVELGRDARALSAAGRSLLFAAVTVPVEAVLGLGLALLLAAPFRGRGPMRAVVLVPWVLPSAIMAMAWAFVFHDSYGPFGDLLARVGLADRGTAWLGRPASAFLRAAAADVWKTTPFVAVILLAGLQTIPRELYDAISVDGGGAWARFRHVTLPLLRPYLAVAALAAYPIARGRLPGAAWVERALLAGAVFPPIVLVAPLYELCWRIGALNRPGTLVLIYTALNLPFAVWSLAGYFRSLPSEIEDAALVDGFSRLGLLTRVVLPLAAPGFATTGLLVFVFAWNEFLLAWILMPHELARTVPVGIAMLTGVSEYEVPWDQISAAVVVTTLPVVALVLFAQRRIVEGLTAGGVKG